MERVAGGSSNLGKGIGVVVTLICIAVALFSYQDMLPARHSREMLNHDYLRWMPGIVHAFGAPTALLLAPWQFWSRLRRQRPRLHRWTGRTYVAACMIGGMSGFMLALTSGGGVVSAVGFGLLGVVWIYTTAMAWRFAVRRDFMAHRRWMIRSFALTFAAITFRLYLLTGVGLALEPISTYRVISFICWMPNLLLAEIYLRRRPHIGVGRASLERAG